MAKGTKWFERFWDRVKIVDDATSCWEWQGGRLRGGYGSVCLVFGSTTQAHRLAWMLQKGDIPKGMFICHKCDNPPCVRIDHLFLGTRTDNMRDCANKKRFMVQKHPDMNPFNNPDFDRRGEGNGRAKVTEDQVREIRTLRANGVPQKVVAEHYMINVSSVAAIHLRTSWNHIQ